MGLVSFVVFSSIGFTLDATLRTVFRVLRSLVSLVVVFAVPRC